MSDGMVEDSTSEEGSVEDSSDDDSTSIISEDTWAQVVTYKFTDWMCDSTYLVEESTADDPKPIPSYRISTTLNLAPFFPICYVTQVSRPGAYSGELVGQFEFSLNQKRGLLTIGNTTTPISNVLSIVDADPRHFEWDFKEYIFQWDCRTILSDGSSICVCRTGDSKKSRLATFMPPSLTAPRRLSTRTLNVYPDGQGGDILDHIVLSALVVERKLTRKM